MEVHKIKTVMNEYRVSCQAKIWTLSKKEKIHIFEQNIIQYIRLW